MEARKRERIKEKVRDVDQQWEETLKIDDTGFDNFEVTETVISYFYVYSIIF